MMQFDIIIRIMRLISSVLLFHRIELPSSKTDLMEGDNQHV